MRTNPVVWTLLALSVLAQNNGLPSSGPLIPGFGRTPEALRIIEAAGRNPNVTSSVTSTRTYNNTPETWAWRVNITDIAVPDRISDLGIPSASFSQGLHVANTQWQLEWPGNDDSLQAFLGRRNMSVRFTALVSNKPSNITDRYNATDNGNCATILGDQCTQSLTQAASTGSTINILGLEGCENTLSVKNGNQDTGVGFSISPAESNSSSSDTSVLSRSDTLFYQTSETYVAGNSTLLNQSKSALQVFIMSFKYGGGNRGDTSGATVLCQIVDKTAVSAANSATVDLHQSTVALWGMLMLSALVIM